MTELAQRAVACRHWRWLPGMLPLDGTGFSNRILQVRDDGMPIDGHGALPDAGPDLTDPATVGCLLALVREAVEPQRAPGDWPMVCPYQSQGKKWGVGAWLNESGKATFAALVLPTYDTEAEALVAALEGAP